jgi:hypothetical protein
MSIVHTIPGPIVICYLVSAGGQMGQMVVDNSLLSTTTYGMPTPDPVALSGASLYTSTCRGNAPAPFPTKR